MTKQMNETTPPTPEAHATSAPRQPSPSATQRQGWLAGLRLRPWMLKWGMNLWPPLTCGHLFAARRSGGDKDEPRITVFVRNEQGETVAEVDKTLYVRRLAHSGRTT